MEKTLTKLTDLTAAEYNPRIISDKALNGLKFSIEEFGDISGIVFNIRTKQLVAGHQRVKALMEKYGDVQIKGNKIFIPGTKEYFNIRIVDWDVNKEKAANVAANSPTIQGEFSNDLTLILDEISLETPDIFKSLNFEDIDLSSFLESDLNQPTIELPKEESEIPQLNRNPLKFGKTTLYLSDEETTLLENKIEEYAKMSKTTFGFFTWLILKKDVTQ